MKKLLLILLLVSSVVLVHAQDGGERSYLTKSLSADNVKKVEVQTSGGSIAVIGVPASEARVEVYIKGNSGKKLSEDEIKSILEEKYDLSVTVSDNKLTAIAKTKKKITNWKRALSISFTVFAPKEITTDLNTSGGSISLSDLSGKQDFTTSGGSLNVKNVSGKVNGRTSGGSIYVKNATDDIELSTSGGSIFAKNCSGHLVLTTSGGSLELGDLDGNIRATTSGGSIKGSKIAGELSTYTSGGSIRLDDITASLEASTSGGNIDIAITSLAKYVKIRNSGGNIELQLPKDKGIDLNLSASKIKTTEFTNFTGRTDDNKIEGKINGGGVLVDARTGSGRLSLLFK